jgi:hypothetical protein
LFARYGYTSDLLCPGRLVLKSQKITIQERGSMSIHETAMAKAWRIGSIAVAMEEEWRR